MFAKRTNWNLAPNRFTRALAAHKKTGRELLDLTASNPTDVGLTFDPAVLEALTHPDGLRYSPEPRGMPSAREAVSGYYHARGDRVSPENIILTTSTSEAYTFVFRLL